MKLMFLCVNTLRKKILEFILVNLFSGYIRFIHESETQMRFQASLSKLDTTSFGFSRDLIVSFK